MTLVSRDLKPPSTPYEAELRERLEAAQLQVTLFHALALAQDAVVSAARAAVTASHAAGEQFDPNALQSIDDALRVLDREAGRILLDMVPPEMRAAFTGASAIEGALATRDALSPGATAAEVAPTTAAALDVDGFARDLENAGPLEVEQLAGQGWPAGWADYTGISDQEIVWPVQPKGQPVPGGTPIAAFASHGEQALYWRLRNAAPRLLAVVRAASALRDTTVPHYRWCRRAHDLDPATKCTCEATPTNEKLDALRAALRGT